MRLSEYLRTSRRGTARRLALALGVHGSAVTRWAVGDSVPTPPKIAEIERLTDGQVTADDWPPQPYRRRGPLSRLRPADHERAIGAVMDWVDAHLAGDVKFAGDPADLLQALDAIIAPPAGAA